MIIAHFDDKSIGRLIARYLKNAALKVRPWNSFPAIYKQQNRRYTQSYYTANGRYFSQGRETISNVG